MGREMAIIDMESRNIPKTPSSSKNSKTTICGDTARLVTKLAKATVRFDRTRTLEKTKAPITITKIEAVSFAVSPKHLTR